MSATEAIQKQICERIGSSFVPSPSHLKVGLALSSLDKSPLYGVRSNPEGDTTGWYIWAGPHSEAADFFQPVHAVHLEELCPPALKYLGLAPGYKFIVDKTGYEDIWFDDSPASPRS